jgi:hypothetical protein
LSLDEFHDQSIFFLFFGFKNRQMMLDQAPKDRQIETIPASFLNDVTPYKLTDFRPNVKAACQTNQLMAAGLKIAKAIVVGNVAVGKSSLVNR